MASPRLSSILEQAAEQTARKDKIEYLRRNANPSLLVILRHMFDPNIKFQLPEGDPPFNEFEGLRGEADSRLYQELRKLYLFVEGGHSTLHQLRRETLFIELLESIAPEDAKMLLAMKDKKPYPGKKGLTKKLIVEAFPDLIPS